MTTSPQLELHEVDGALFITIPFGTREKIWMTVALTAMLVFGLMMSLVAEYAARSATSFRALQLIPLAVLGVIIAFYLLSLLTIRSMPGSVVEFDGKTLSIGSIGSQRRTSWPREKIKSLRVSRLPMVPIANLVIQAGDDPSVRTGVCRQRDLEMAATRLRAAIGLTDRNARAGERK